MTDSIVEAVLDELAETGYGRLTMENVAKRAGSSKTTLYRRWASKQDMVLDAVATASRPPVVSSNAEDLRGQLLDLARDVHTWLSGPLMRRIIPDLLAEGMRSRAIDKALTIHIGEPRRKASAQILAATRDRGEIRRDADIDLALDLLAAPIYWRLCALRTDVDDDYLRSLVELVHGELTDHTRGS